MKSIVIRIGFCVAMVSLICACEKEKNTPTRGSMIVKMTDEAAPFDEVNVEIKQVQLHYEESKTNAGWLNIITQAGIYNLLDYQDGFNATIADMQPVPTGRITSMRILAGTQNTVKQHGAYYPLDIAGPYQNGITLHLNIRMRDHDKVELIFDFNGAQSIQESNGAYTMKPAPALVSVRYR